MDSNAEKIMDTICYDPVSGDMKWLVSGRGRTKRKGSVVGSISPEGYRRIHTLGRDMYAHRVAWLIMTGEWPLTEIDHINGDRSDNRWINLRLATAHENRRNSVGHPSRRKSEYKGVTKSSRGPTWTAKIWVNGKQLNLGYFQTEIEAANAYKDAAIKHYGEFAKW